MRIRASKIPLLSSISDSPPSLSPSLNSPPSNDSSSRCEGLDLLVLAVIEVFGDGALEIERIGSSGVGEEEGKQEGIEMRKEELDGGVEAGTKRKSRRRPLATPSRFQDSVLQPWKRRTRRRLSEGKRSAGADSSLSAAASAFAVGSIAVAALPLRITNMVFLEVEMAWNVVILPEQLDANGLLLHKAIILRLMDDIANRKASKEHGYYVAVTTLNSIGEGKVRELSGDVLFPVTFSCITQKPAKGEILVGTVDKILKQGVFLKSGPISSIFLSEKMMRDYKYVGGENPMFLNDKHAKLEKDTMVRFKVLGLKWLESDREFQILATLAGDFLGSL
ncbi:DNA-directed RNA polymerase [Musa troglodytarum]|uniref:DNA-directed RNA polymerase subunit n=1 Tax=Musa troglodytarum TaxID=320322 RepID=A0A9E7FMG6_9LILI|nr:DNA-directed RNA polymerase [Musa troglodytarum]